MGEKVGGSVGRLKALGLTFVFGVFLLVFYLAAFWLVWPERTSYELPNNWGSSEAPSSNPDGLYHPLQHTEEDVYYLAQAIYFEARGEPAECQQDVAQVIQNRVYSEKYPNSYFGVIWQHRQFSYTQDGKREDINNEYAFELALDIAKKVLRGYVVDNTGGSLYYFNPDIVDPTWKVGYNFQKECGGHYFYRNKVRYLWG